MSRGRPLFRRIAFRCSCSRTCIFSWSFLLLTTAAYVADCIAFRVVERILPFFCACLRGVTGWEGEGTGAGVGEGDGEELKAMSSGELSRDEAVSSSAEHGGTVSGLQDEGTKRDSQMWDACTAALTLETVAPI